MITPRRSTCSMPGRVQSGDEPIAVTRATLRSAPANEIAISPPIETPHATTPREPTPCSSSAQSMTRIASSVVRPRIGHIRNRNAAKTPAEKSPGDSLVARLPCCHGSMPTPVNPARAKRRRVRAPSSLVPPKYGIQSASLPLDSSGSAHSRGMSSTIARTSGRSAHRPISTPLTRKSDTAGGAPRRERREAPPVHHPVSGR